MAARTKTYPQASRDLIAKSKARRYLIQVANGEVDEPDEKRIATCRYLLDKVLPNPPTSTITHESDKPPDFQIVHPD